jgi:hypothetical protein
LQEGRGWEWKVGGGVKWRRMVGRVGKEVGEVLQGCGKGGGREGGCREGKQAAKETNQIMQKNKSTMLDDFGSNEVNADMIWTTVLHESRNKNEKEKPNK